MDDSTQPDTIRELWFLVAVVLIATAAAGIILLIDFQLKRRIVAEATLLKEAGYVQGLLRKPESGGAGSVPGVPGPVTRVRGVDDLGGDAAAPQDGDTPSPAPLVSPGDDSARPPHRGGVDRPGGGHR